MGGKIPKTIRDFVRYDMAIEVACRCGHVERLDGRAVFLIFHRRRWPVGLGSALRRFRCTRCGGRACRLGPMPRD